MRDMEGRLMACEIHRSKVGTYHPPVCKNHTPGCGCQDAPLWTIHDTRGYLDGGQACDECGACECAWCECEEHEGKEITVCRTHFDEEHECIGLSFAFVCLDGGDVLCEECAEKEGITIVECDCK